MIDWTEAYANADRIPGGAGYPARWAAAAADHRRLEAALGRAELNLPYGPDPRQRWDLFLPAGRPEGLVLFLHGGYWRAFGREDWSHLAAGPAARGWAVGIPSYPLAPAARIAAIGRAASAAAEAAAARVRGPVVLCGHSAGAQLAAVAAVPGRGADLGGRLVRVVPVSPLADLRPLLRTALNADLRLDPAEARAESPALMPPPAVPVHVWVGADERPAFRDQARWLAAAWGARLTVEPGRHHFDVVEGLADPDSPLARAVTGADSGAN